MNILNPEKSTDYDSESERKPVIIAPPLLLIVIIGQGAKPWSWRFHSQLEPKIHSPIFSNPDSDSTPSSHQKEGEEQTLNLKFSANSQSEGKEAREGEGEKKRVKVARWMGLVMSS